MLNSKTVLLAIAIAGSFAQVAESSTLDREKIRNDNKSYLKKMGITILDGEVRIVNAKTLIAQTKDDYYASQIQRYLAMHKEQEINGFLKEPEPRAKELLDFNNASKYQFKKYINELSNNSTHIRHTIPELKMAYTFIGVPESEMDKNIGVAPYGGYKQVKYGDDADGWDGAVQFFVKNDIGTCEFREHNIKLAHGGVELVQELVSDDVFGKPTVILTKGNQDTGYLYQVSWYDNTFSRELSCAALSFDFSIKNKVITLARTIDEAQ